MKSVADFLYNPNLAKNVFEMLTAKYVNSFPLLMPCLLGKFNSSNSPKCSLTMNGTIFVTYYGK